MFPIGSVIVTPPSAGGGGGGSTPTLPVWSVSQSEWNALTGRVETLEEAPTGPNGLTESEVQGWIRGNGLFRPVCNVFGDVNMTDAHWQSFLVAPYITQPAPVTVSVTTPSAALVDTTNQFVVPPGFPVDKPAGTWTYIINPNNVNTVTVLFPSIATVTGYNGTSYTTGTTWTVPQGRMMLVMFIGVNHFYVQLL